MSAQVYTPQSFVWMPKGQEDPKQQLADAMKHLENVAKEFPNNWVIKLEIFAEESQNASDINQLFDIAEKDMIEHKNSIKNGEIVPVGLSKNGKTMFMAKIDADTEPAIKGH